MSDLQPHRRLTAEQRQSLGATLAAQYQQGQSIAQLAAQQNTSAGRVRSLLLEHGVVLRPRGGPTGRQLPGRQEIAVQVAQQYTDGASLGELAQRHGRSPSGVRALVQAGGGTLRPRGGRRPSPSQTGT